MKIRRLTAVRHQVSVHRNVTTIELLCEFPPSDSWIAYADDVVSDQMIQVCAAL